MSSSEWYRKGNKLVTAQYLLINTLVINHEYDYLKGYSEIIAVTTPSIFIKSKIFLHFVNGIRCMNLTLKGIVKICPCLITKRGCYNLSARQSRLHGRTPK